MSAYDCLGREIVYGQFVSYRTCDGGPFLGRVMGVKDYTLRYGHAVFEIQLKSVERDCSIPESQTPQRYVAMKPRIFTRPENLMVVSADTVPEKALSLLELDAVPCTSFYGMGDPTPARGLDVT